MRALTRLLAFLLSLALWGAAPGAALEPPAKIDAPSDALASFLTELEVLATQHHLPGLSAAIVRDQEVIWSGGFGFAEVEKQIPADADTPYRIASLTKPIAAAVLMQLVEEERLDLESPMQAFGNHAWFEPGGGSWAHYPERYADGRITVRHVLTHTSEGETPGQSYSYNGNIFADLTWVIETVTRSSYPRVVQERVFDPVGMSRSAAGQLVPWKQEVVAEIAKPYQVADGQPQAATYPGFGLDPDVDATTWNLDPAYRLPRQSQDGRRRVLGAAFTPLYSSQTAAGMVTTVRDLARFDIALDRGDLVAASSREQMFTPMRTGEGVELPYGLGWFIEQWRGTKLVWHYGWFPPSVSALYLKIPDHKLTLLLLTNCDGLSAAVAWTASGVTASPFARLFLEHFVALGDRPGA